MKSQINVTDNVGEPDSRHPSCRRKPASTPCRPRQQQTEGVVKEKGKRFFFEKKKQKTFGPAGAGNAVAKARRTEVFFASRPAWAFLFTKKKVFLPCVAF